MMDCSLAPWHWWVLLLLGCLRAGPHHPSREQDDPLLFLMGKNRMAKHGPSKFCWSAVQGPWLCPLWGEILVVLQSTGVLQSKLGGIEHGHHLEGYPWDSNVARLSSLHRRSGCPYFKCGALYGPGLS